MARLFLHIGGHKTGTSYLQALFYQNKSRLLANGINYLPTYPYKAHHQLARNWISAAKPDRHQKLARSPAQAWSDVLQPCVTRGDGTVFLSSEVFSQFSFPRVDMAELARRLAQFDQVRIIYTLRAQTELINSAWIERVKKRSSIWPRKYVKQALETRRAFGAALDHHAFYHHLLTGFAPEQILLLDYHAMHRAPGGVGQCFLDILDANLDITDLQSPPSAAQNISPDGLALWLATRIHHDGPPPASLVETITDALHGDSPRRSTILSEVEHARVMSKFRDGNVRLTALVQHVQPGFSFAPPNPSDNLLYRNQLPADIWRDIAAGLWAGQSRGRRKKFLTGALGIFAKN